MATVSSLELIFLGTGAAQQDPSIGCLVKPELSCQACLERGKNDRGTASAIVKVIYEDSSFKTILLDCGDSFLDRACQIFPQYGLRRIDAVLLSHEHGDAVSGLASLKKWVEEDGIQQDILIYANEKTWDETSLQWSFLQHPCQPQSEDALPAFKTRLIKDDEAFNLFDVRVTPLPSHHGMRKGQPNICLGYLFDRSIAYMSDSNLILESTWRILEKARPPVLVTEALGMKAHSSHFGFAQAVATARRSQAARTYFTQIAHSTSHSQWVALCQRIQAGARASQLQKVEQPGGHQARFDGNAFAALMHRTGLSRHELLMGGLVQGIVGNSISTAHVIEEGLAEVEAWEGGPQQPVWIRPAYDSLRVTVDAKTGQINDNYEETQGEEVTMLKAVQPKPATYIENERME